MKLQANPHSGQTITEHGPGWVSVNRQIYQHNICINSRSGVTAWSCTSFEALSHTHFSELAAQKPELVVLGTGSRITFPHPSLWQELMTAGIGMEVMNSSAACRTFNVLSAEDRHVVLALFL
jgi:uncharacterized protein